MRRIEVLFFPFRTLITVLRLISRSRIFLRFVTDEAQRRPPGPMVRGESVKCAQRCVPLMVCQLYTTVSRRREEAPSPTRRWEREGWCAKSSSLQQRWVRVNVGNGPPWDPGPCVWHLSDINVHHDAQTERGWLCTVLTSLGSWPLWESLFWHSGDVRTVLRCATFPNRNILRNPEYQNRAKDTRLANDFWLLCKTDEKSEETRYRKHPCTRTSRMSQPLITWPQTPLGVLACR